jgi:ribosome-associated protein
VSRDDESPREAKKREKREAGDRSARVARQLMDIAETSLSKLDLDEDLREAIDEARRVTSQIARRRAERTLAGELRHIDIAELQRKMANVEETGSAEPRLFHAAERWRTRLIEEGSAAAAEFPGGYVEPLPQLIQNARRERDTGKPPGAQRALFRHVMAVLKREKLLE